MPSTKVFQQKIWDFYAKNKRDFPWRQTSDPYAILVSELMLQQTQTARVVPYYLRFLQKFPTVKKLAAASQKEVLEIWQGLGYNRRALFLHQTAQKIVKDFSGRVPENLEDLIKLPGVGANTAGAILVYAFNQPAVFIETNIRKTIIHFFFTKQAKINDVEIIAVVAKALDQKNPREWYWALVDYGSALGNTKAITNDRSAHYHKQTQFVGSKRFARSQILKLLLREPKTEKEILERFANLPHTATALDELLHEGFCVNQKKLIRIRE